MYCNHKRVRLHAHIHLVVTVVESREKVDDEEPGSITVNPTPHFISPFTVLTPNQRHEVFFFMLLFCLCLILSRTCRFLLFYGKGFKMLRSLQNYSSWLFFSLSLLDPLARIVFIVVVGLFSYPLFCVSILMCSTRKSMSIRINNLYCHTHTHTQIYIHICMHVYTKCFWYLSIGIFEHHHSFCVY